MPEPPAATISVAGCEVMVGSAETFTSVTSSVTLLLTIAPAALLTTTEYAPALGRPTLLNDSTAPVAPAMFTPSRRHWKASGPVPLTPTANDADCPAFTASETGCATIVGATTAGELVVTVSVAAMLATLPAPLVTLTV